MARVSLLAVVLALALALAPANAFWILSHHPLVSERLDMIVSPGALSGHTHTFVGSAAVTVGQNNSDYCTTAPVKADLSNYWTPQLYYYRGDSNTFDSVPLGSVNTYYLNRGGPKMGENSSLLHPFPKGLKMLAGSATAYDGPLADSTAAKAVSFVCLNYTEGTGSPQTTTLPSGPCLDGMRAQIIFPSCWDGVNLDSSNHQSHVAYPINGQPDTGDCPTTHPVKFMTLFYEFIYNTGSLQSVSNGTSSSGFVLANGDAVGYSFHGDFVSGWDQEVLTDAIDQCSGNLFGDLDSCAPFLPTLHYETSSPNSDPDAGYCTTTSSVNEKVLGTGFANLPNCQVVRNGPFKGAGSCTNTTQVVPTITVVSNSTGPTNANYQGCYKDPTGGRALKTKLTSLTASKMTIESCQAGCTAAGYSVAGLQYADECWCGNSFTYGTTKLKDEFCNMACAGNSTEICGAGNTNSVYSTSPVTTLSLPVIPATAGSANYWGCYAEGTGSRLLKSASYANSSNTPTQCANYCTAKGYPFSGTEYSSECYCGTSAMMKSAVLGSDSGCSMLCSGNATSYCGGSSRLQIYSAMVNPNATVSNSNTVASNSTNSTIVSSTTQSTSSSSTSTPLSSSTSLSSTSTPLSSTSTSKTSTSTSTTSTSTSKNSTSTSTKAATSTKASSTTLLVLSTTTIRITSTSTGLATTKTTTRTTTSTITKTTVVAANGNAVALPTATSSSSSSSSSSSTKRTTSSTKKTTSSSKKTTSTKKRARSLPTRLPSYS
ncbi:WSC-domain-containing protein [Microstroma glucosiphilum]|uniref:WSC-domain-containing protein n=1 Tax=Pseudomicrostroma glucosiphilum TaxID=1684307 RepID=A0A316U4G4_9BASI|nr:WSC-domain-containing protein [Pseudomicrostroma glucosiphilum]PWN20147.1 WSC-domain-containing protein [Pseudomicrostroma glucosiphilum]